jgi:hypothetical protein
MSKTEILEEHQTSHQRVKKEHQSNEHDIIFCLDKY